MENSYSYLELANKRKKLEIVNLRICNEYTAKYGLILTDSQIISIIEKKNESLRNTGRVEIKESIIDRIIKEFCDSPYILQENYVQTIYELLEIFYEYKNQTMDLISDNDLIKFMKKSFDEICQGDLEYLSGTIMEEMKQNVLKGKPLDYKEGEEDNIEKY